MKDPVARKRAGSARPDTISGSLLDRVKANDAHAWERLVNLYGPLVYRWTRRSELQPADAADVMQEVFREVADHVAEFQEERPTHGFRGWLWAITRNKVNDHFRDQANRPQPKPGIDEATEACVGFEPKLIDPEESRVDYHNIAMVHRVLEAIHPDFEETTWEAFWQMTIQERSSAEVAEELGMTKSAVRQAKYRVLRRLRDELTAH